MVYVNAQKYACVSCIKGHRSSLCNHSDRPLFEIKKKGRPVSQCDKCRAARHSRKFHSKCECKAGKDDEARVELVASGSKTRRYIPILPALPHGLKDVLHRQTGPKAMASRQRVESLLNPCQCKDIRDCQCQNSNVADPSTFTALAQPLEDGAAAQDRSVEAGTNAGRNCCQQNATPRSNQTHENHTNIPVHPQPPLDLPPIMSAPTSPTEQAAQPVFPVMPPVSSIKSLAGTGCTCGFQCRCPGCVEHRTPKFASKDHKDCADGCGTCIDLAGGIELPPNLDLPGHHPSGCCSGSPSQSILDRFLVRAATLPRPPPGRKTGVRFDPTDVSVHAVVLVSKGAGLVERHKLPKLKCCSGECGCARGYCRCEEMCDGACNGGHDRGPCVSIANASSIPSRFNRTATKDVMLPSTTTE